MKVVIMAGGKGTRIASVNSEVPKPMIPILGKPILEYQIETLKRQGYTDITLVVGHMANVLKDYFSDGRGVSPATGKPFGVQISYIVEMEPLGTAGALYLLKEQLTEDFLLLNGDIIFDVNIARFLSYHKEHGGMATILTHPNSHPYDSGIIIANADNCVTNWLHKEDQRTWYRNRVNAGIHLISPKLLNNFTKLEKLDLDRDVLKPLIASKKLFVYDSPEYVKDMGTPDRYYSVTENIKSGLVQAKNLSNKQKAVFWDRDGTINKYVGFLKDIDQFELVEGIAQVMREISDAGYLNIVVTNQPVVARGEVTFEELDSIHNKMETLLGQQGAFVDAIYYCPHHPHRGYDGEVAELKIDCDCRKPKPGMLLQAAKDYNVDLSESWMVGDGENDILAAENAGCKAVYIGEDTNVENKYPNLIKINSVDELMEKIGLH